MCWRRRGIALLSFSLSPQGLQLCVCVCVCVCVFLLRKFDFLFKSDWFSALLLPVRVLLVAPAVLKDKKTHVKTCKKQNKKLKLNQHTTPGEKTKTKSVHPKKLAVLRSRWSRNYFRTWSRSRKQILIKISAVSLEDARMKKRYGNLYLY